MFQYMIFYLIGPGKSGRPNRGTSSVSLDCEITWLGKRPGTGPGDPGTTRAVLELTEICDGQDWQGGRARTLYLAPVTAFAGIG
jgi:hypothetical protein